MNGNVARRARCLGLILVPALAVAGPANEPHGGAPRAGAPRADAPRAAIAELPAAVMSNTGTIEGVVELPARQARRTVNRYAGSGTATARALQEMPVIAYLEGPIAGAPAARPGRLEIAQRDTAFAPSAVVVPVGASVAFPNHDSFFHNVFSFSPAKRFDLGRYGRGESKSVEFDRPGVVRVYCEVHQFMRAVIIAVENPYHALVDDDGRFTLRDVPAGRHRLVIWDAERRPQELDVEVSAGGVTHVVTALR